MSHSLLQLIKSGLANDSGLIQGGIGFETGHIILDGSGRMSYCIDVSQPREERRLQVFHVGYISAISVTKA